MGIVVRRISVVLLLALSGTVSLAQDAELPTVRENSAIPDRIQRIIDGHNLPDSSFSFFVQEVGAEQALFTFNADKAMNPASAIKTVTTLAALESLGPAFTWQTELYALGPIQNGVLRGDLLMKGGGDPFMIEDQLRGMLKSLQRAGV